MYVDSSQNQARPFVYVQYPDVPNTTPSTVNTRQRIPTCDSSSSSSASSVISQKEEPKKKKRQHIGYACDKCRERRVGCDRGKPICGQCKDRYQCQYSNHALRLDNVSMRQRLDELENQVGWLTSFATNLEKDYRSSVPRINHTHVQLAGSSTVTQSLPLPQQQQQQQPQQQNVIQQQHILPPTVVDWAISTGWPVIESAQGLKTIFTTIKNFEDLSAALKSTVQLIYSEKGNPLYRHVNPKEPPEQVVMSQSQSNHEEHSFTLFESLNRYTSTKNQHTVASSHEERYLETDVMTRLIHQHHKCGFPTLVSPSRFENHYRQGQLKPLVLSSVFSHSVPHVCIYHPHLTQIQDFRELGNKFYNHSHDLLGIDEPANLSNIHQRTLLITYDLDLGRVRRAFLHIGIAIRMCFMLNLHRMEGYLHCKSAFEREQAKRIFWTVWFYDNMVNRNKHIL